MRILVFLSPPLTTTATKNNEKIVESFMKAVPLVLNNNHLNVAFILVGFNQKFKLPNQQWLQCDGSSPNSVTNCVQTDSWDFVLFTHVNTSVNFVLLLQRTFHLSGAARGTPIVWGNTKSAINECVVSYTVFLRAVSFKCQTLYALQDVWVVTDSRYIVTELAISRFVGYPGIVEPLQNSKSLLVKAKKLQFVYSWWHPETKNKSTTLV
jgi:hypothetical protein